jgi:anhydro-N-acetylmuramic acid kinase
MASFAGNGEWTVLGLMCGTSLDGLDAARLRLRCGEQGLEAWELIDWQEAPYPPALRAVAEALIQGEAVSAAAFAGLHVGLGRAFADFVRARFPAPIADLAGFPGQTIWHDPDGAQLSLQIGSPAAFAALSGLPTVGEFRLPDVLAGGQGAPLVPLADALLHRDPREYRALLNIGGIANLTLLPPGRGTQGVRAWDTGPGNTLLDGFARLVTGAPCDEDGRLAAAGRVLPALLAEWLAEPWFRRPPPKSTGREFFGGRFLAATSLTALRAQHADADLAATLVALTVESVAAALAGAPVDRLYVAGGGSANPVLMAALAARLAPLPIATSAALGLPPAAKEAADFAVLALEAAAGRPVTLPAVTGAPAPAPAGLFAPGALYSF